MSPKQLRSILLVAAAASAAVLGVATTAPASPASRPRPHYSPSASPIPNTSPSPSGTPGTCPTGNLCLFTGTNYTGSRFTVTSIVEYGTCVSLVDHHWDGLAHSAINTHNSGAAMFLNDDCVGEPYQVPANTSLPDFGGFPPASVWVPRAG